MQARRISALSLGAALLVLTTVGASLAQTGRTTPAIREQTAAAVSRLLAAGELRAAGRVARRAELTDPGFITRTKSEPNLRVALGDQWPAVHIKLLDSATGHPDDAAGLALFLRWSGAEAEAAPWLALANPPLPDPQPAAQSAGDLRTASGFALARVADIAQASPTDVGIALALLLSSGDLSGADHLLDRWFRVHSDHPVLPGSDVSRWWNRDGILSGLTLMRQRNESGAIRPVLLASPSVSLALALMGQKQMALGLAAEAANGQPEQRVFAASFARDFANDYQAPRVWQTSADRLLDYGLVMELPAVREALRAGNLASATSLLIRTPAEHTQGPKFHLLSGVTMLAGGMEQQAEASIRVWIIGVAEEMQKGRLASVAVGFLPSEVAPRQILKRLEQPVSPREAMALTLLRFGEAAGTGDPAIHDLRDAIVARGGDRLQASELKHWLDLIAGERPQPTAAELLASGDAEFAAGSYRKAFELWLAAGQQDELLAGLDARLLRGAFACQEWESAGQWLSKMLAAGSVTDVPAARRFDAKILAAFPEANRRHHATCLEELRKAADAKPVDGQLWLLLAVVERDAGNRDRATSAFEGVVRIAPHGTVTRTHAEAMLNAIR